MCRLLLLLALTGLVFLANCGGGSSTGSSGGGGTGGGQATLQSITVKPGAAAIAPGTTQQFTATGNYSDGSMKDLTLTAQWSCLVSTLATVSNDSPTQGLAMAVLPGTALITASMGSVSNSGQLTIKDGLSVTALELSPPTATIGFGNQQQFKATATFSDQSQQDVTNVSQWSLSQPPFITSNSGLAIGQSVGSNSVMATFNGSGNGNAPLTVDLSNLVSMSLLPSSPFTANHTQVQFTAIGTFSDGSTRDITSLVTSSFGWSSSNPAVASFGFTGSSVSAHSSQTPMATTIAGSITSSTGTIIASASTTLTVTSAQLQSIVLFPVNASIAPATELNLTAIGIFSDSTTQDLTSELVWSAVDPSVASVERGVATGVSSGETTVNASSRILGSAQGSTQLNVTSATLNSIAVTPSNTFIPPGGTLTYSAIGSFSDNSIQDVSNVSTWSSKPTNVATIPLLSGVATGQGVGRSTITAKLGSVSGTATLLVASPQQISINTAPTTVQIASQTSTQLTAKGTFVDGGVQDLTTVVNWTSSSAKVATVGGQTGTITGLAPGQATMTATLGSVSTTSQVTVTNASLVSITVLPAGPSIALGSSQQFTATGKFSDGSAQTLLGATWSSSGPTIAVVDDSGLATSTGLGTATIKATLNGISGTTNLTVH
jgi:trimeric autotransporter adhesin